MLGDRQLTENFRLAEFACKHCGKVEIDLGFVNRLQEARDVSGMALVIRSGYRCPEYDEAIGGSGKHPTGKAADIKAKGSRSRYLIVKALLHVGFTRLGIGRDFVHVDECPDADLRVMWDYYDEG